MQISVAYTIAALFGTDKQFILKWCKRHLIIGLTKPTAKTRI